MIFAYKKVMSLVRESPYWPESPESVKRKIKRALSGGRDTLEEHRKLGAIVEKDMAFELMKQHLIEDDKELDKIYNEYKSGKMTSGELKEIACVSNSMSSTII